MKAFLRNTLPLPFVNAFYHGFTFRFCVAITNATTFVPSSEGSLGCSNARR